MKDSREEVIDLLDFAVFLARHWLALVVLPLIAGVLAYVASVMWPSDYLASVKVTVPKSIPERMVDSAFARIVQSSLVEENAAFIFTGREILIQSTALEAEVASAAVKKQLSRVVSAFEPILQQEDIFLELQTVLLRRLESSNDMRAETVREILSLNKSIAARTEVSLTLNAWLGSLQTSEVSTRKTVRPLINAVAIAALTAFGAFSFAVIRTLLHYLTKDDSSRRKLARIRNAMRLKPRLK